MKFYKDKKVEMQIEIIEHKPFGSCESGNKYLAVKDGKIIQVEYDFHEDDEEIIQHFSDDKGNIIEVTEIGNVYNVRVK